MKSNNRPDTGPATPGDTAQAADEIKGPWRKNPLSQGDHDLYYRAFMHHGRMAGFAYSSTSREPAAPERFDSEPLHYFSIIDRDGDALVAAASAEQAHAMFAIACAGEIRESGKAVKLYEFSAAPATAEDIALFHSTSIRPPRPGLVELTEKNIPIIRDENGAYLGPWRDNPLSDCPENLFVRSYIGPDNKPISHEYADVTGLMAASPSPTPQPKANYNPFLDAAGRPPKKLREIVGKTIAMLRAQSPALAHSETAPRHTASSTAPRVGRSRPAL